MKVLLVIDLQRDFCPGGTLAVSGGDEIVPLVNRLLRDGAYDLSIATLDWHPQEHGSFASNHRNAKPFEVTELDGVTQILWPNHCVQGSPGAELHPDLAAHSIDYFVKKGMNPQVDSYSGFFDNQRRGSTELLQILENEVKQRGISLRDVELHVVGLALDYCVAFTALDAKELGLSTSVVVDATRSVNLHQGDDEKTLRRLAASGISLLTSREILTSRSHGEKTIERSEQRTI